MNKVVELNEIKKIFKDGQSIMIGGFLHAGRPDRLINTLLELGVKDLTIIGNDTGTPDRGVGQLVVKKQVKKAIVTHIGTNIETGRQMIAGEIEVELMPQGTMIEGIRAAGSGLGGFLTPTGIGTIIEKGKEKININGQEYLLELPIKADIAIIKAYKADRMGNLIYNGSARNYNPIMAMAADLVIAEVDEIVEVGSIDPNNVVTPSVFVDKIILAKGGNDSGKYS